MKEETAPTSARETYRESLTSFKMEVTPDNFPINILSEVQIERLQETILEVFETL